MRLPEARERSAPPWMVWSALGVVYVVWGSTYLAIAIVIETLPPMLAAAVRFLVAGVLLYAWLVVRRGPGVLRSSRREVAASLSVGTLLLLGGNGIVMLAERDVPSGLAALLIASTPLWVVLLRYAARERVDRGTLAGVAVGFAGVALLVAPGERPDGASLLGMLSLLGAALFWGTGSFLSKRLPLPKDPLVSTALQMVMGSFALLLAGVLLGEFGRIDVEGFSTRSLLALAYLIVFGSLLAFTSYVWVLQHAPISKVATYAYVNPVIAIFLGWLILSEEITALMLAGAAVIVASVASIVRRESRPAPEIAAAPPATAPAVDTA